MRVRTLLYLGLAALMVVLAGCEKAQDAGFQGWVESDLVFVGPDESGRIENLSVSEGETVAQGARLFSLDDDLQRADVMQNTATITNARQTLERAEQLLKNHAGTQKAFDDAQQALREAEAKLHSSQTRLARRRVASPVAGTVKEIYFRTGEIVPSGRPVVALLPPANVKVRFFIPEGMLPKITLGEVVNIRCDGCAGDLTARVFFIARTAEYTPPVIYSLDERAKLVFLIEARPSQPEKMRIGQPVSVTLKGQEPNR